MGVRTQGSSTSAKAPGSHSSLPDEPVGRGHVFPGALLRDLVPLLPAGAGRSGGPPHARDHLSAAQPCSPKPSCRPVFSWTLISFLGVRAIPSGKLSVSPPQSGAFPEAGAHGRLPGCSRLVRHVSLGAGGRDTGSPKGLRFFPVTSCPGSGSLSGRPTPSLRLL